MTDNNISKKQKTNHNNDNNNIKQLYDNNNNDIVIKFSQSYSNKNESRDLRLIETSMDMIKKIKLGNDTLRLIGSKGDDTVLCTNDQTYSIKKVETSNSVFLIPSSLNNEYNIIANCGTYYELKAINGRIEQLEELLKQTQYNGSDDDNNNTLNLLSRNDLEQYVQASKKELDDAFDKLGVIELQGKMRMISRSASREVIRCVLDTIMENDWSINNIDETLCCNNMKDIDPVLLHAVLLKLGNIIDKNDTTSIWKLDEESIAKSTAHILFCSLKTIKDKTWQCDDFMIEWQSRTPGVSELDQKLLYGIAIKIDNGFKYLPVENMNKDASYRLNQLFQLKRSYSKLELVPYLEDLINDTSKLAMKIDELLLQHTKKIDDLYYQK